MSLDDPTLHPATLTRHPPADTRRVWLRPGPDTPHRLGVLLDGEFYLDRVGVLPIIDALTAAGRIPPMSWLFIESGGAAARHADYTGAPDFTRFVADTLLGWARQRVPLVDGGHLIGGLSLSGLAAGYVALAHPERFAAALCQSGSFWLEPDAFAAAARRDPPNRTRFWLSVGDQETEVGVSHPPTGLYQGITQIDGVARAAAALTPRAAAVHTHTYAGGHAFEPWRDELGDALRWLLAPGSG